MILILTELLIYLTDKSTDKSCKYCLFLNTN